MTPNSKSSESQSASGSGSNSPSPHARLKLRAGRFTLTLPLPALGRTRVMVFAAMLFAASSLTVWQQMGAYLPGAWHYESPPNGPRWWAVPLEFHRAAALPEITGTINAVAVQSGTPSRIWIAGNAGLLFSSDDEGRHWTKFDYDVTRAEFRRHDPSATPASSQQQAPGSTAAPKGAAAAAQEAPALRLHAPEIVATLYAAQQQQGPPRGIRPADQKADLSLDPGLLMPSPSAVTFGEMLVGASSLQSVQVYNSAKASNVTVLAVSIEPDSRDFDAKSDCDKRTLGPGERCALSVFFHPPSGGQRTGALVVRSDALNSPTRIPLTGIALAPSDKAGTVGRPTPSTPPDTTPTVPAPAKKPTAPPDLHGVGFTSAAAGWVSAASDFAYVTVDAGATWQFRSPTGESRIGQSKITDGADQWQVRQNGAVSRSRDAGESWEPVTRSAVDPAEFDGVGAHWVLLPPWYLLLSMPVCLLLGLVARLIVEEAPAIMDDGVSEILTSDKPLEPGDVDVLNLREIASGLSRFLRHEKTMPPLTVAVIGEWGSGKSSLMNLLKKDLQSYGYRPVWFNAWHHQTEEHLLAALLQTVRLEAVPPAMAPSWMLFRWRLLQKRLARNWIAMTLLTSVFALIYAVEATLEGPPYNQSLLSFLQTITGTTTLNIALALENLPLPHFVTVTGALTGLSLLGRGLKAFGVNPAALLTTASSGSSIKDLDAQTGFRQRFAVQFRDVTEALGSRQLVIFIDDLDRCKPENVREVLEAVNFLVSSGECFVILGMARAQVERSVGLSFKEVVLPAADEAPAIALAQYARKYLDKLINIEVPVPIPTTEQQRRLFVDDTIANARADRGSGEAALVAGQEWRGRLAATAAQYALPVIFAALVGTSAYQIGAECAPWLAQQISQVKLNINAQTNSGTRAADGAAQASPGTVPGTPASGRSPAGSSPATDNASAGGRPAASTPPAGSASASNRGDQLPDVRSASMTVPSAWMLTWPFALVLAGLLLAGRGALLVVNGGVERDSQSFVTALRIWHPLVTAKTNSPRAAKRFLNRVRYIAMRQRRQSQTSPFLRGFLPGRITAQPAGEVEQPIHDSLLVVLAALEQFDSTWLASGTSLANALNGQHATPADGSSLQILKNARAAHEDAAGRNQVKPLVDLESCRERFLRLWPSVTVR